MPPKFILISKTVIGLAIALILPPLARKFGWASDDATQAALADTIMQAIGGALAIYGRMTACTTLTLKPPGVAPLLALALVAGAGCETWNGLTPGAQAALKTAAKLALSFGVTRLGESVKEIRPYQGTLNTLIETTFAKPLMPEKLGAAIKAGVMEKVPAALQAAVLAEFKARLASAAASPLSERSYNARIAGAL